MSYDNTVNVNLNWTPPNVDGVNRPGGLDSNYSDDEIVAGLSNGLNEEYGKQIDRFMEHVGTDPAIREQAQDVINDAMRNNRSPVDSYVEAQIRDNFGGEIDQAGEDLWDLLMTMFTDLEDEDRRKEQMNTDPTSANGLPQLGGDNWFIILVKALAEIQSKWLTLLNEAYGDMQDSVGEGDDKQKAFIDAQARVTAYAKLFGMASEVTSTVTKAVADGLTSVARLR